MEHRVEEQAGPDQLLLALGLVLELGHPLQVAVRGHRGQQPRQLGVLAHVGLAEQDAPLGVEPGSDQHRRRVEHVGGQGGRVVGDARGVQVDDAVDRRVRRAPGRRGSRGSLRCSCRGACARSAGCPRRCARGAGRARGATTRMRSHLVVRVALEVPERLERLRRCRPRRWRASRARARPRARPSRKRQPRHAAPAERRLQLGVREASRPRRSTARRARSARSPTRRDPAASPARARTWRSRLMKSGTPGGHHQRARQHPRDRVRRGRRRRRTCDTRPRSGSPGRAPRAA